MKRRPVALFDVDPEKVRAFAKGVDDRLLLSAKAKNPRWGLDQVGTPTKTDISSLIGKPKELCRPTSDTPLKDPSLLLTVKPRALISR